MLFDLTGTLGVRSHQVTRTAQPREIVRVEVAGHPIDVKIGPARAKAEFDDVVAAATALGRPPAQIAAEAERLAQLD